MCGYVCVVVGGRGGDEMTIQKGVTVVGEDSGGRRGDNSEDEMNSL